MKIGIAGGIGSGKSYVCKLLADKGISVYDSDSAAKRIIRTSPEVREQLRALIGSLEKADIARFLLASEENAQAIDAIVHPAVFRDFQQSGMQWLECAIMYESGADRLVDRVIVVTAPEEVRIARIMRRDGITREKALEWIHRQWPQERVQAKADYEIVNDGKRDVGLQIDDLLKSVYSAAQREKKELENN